MKVFYIKINEFKQKYNKNFLIPYADIKLKTEKRFYEYTIGRYLVKEVAKKYYGINNPEVILDNDGKPVFNNTDLCFSISHSKDIVIACFDNSSCGIDVEHIKKLDLVKLSEYFNQEFKTLEDFYKFWTLKEASYKLHSAPISSFTCKLSDNYRVAITSKNYNKTLFDNLEILPFQKYTTI